MSEDTIKWLMEDTPWLKYAVKTQLLDLKADVLSVLRDQSIGSIISRLKDHRVGIPALKSGKLSYRSTGNAFWDLYFLADMGLNATDTGIDTEVEALFQLQLPDGSFILEDGTEPQVHCVPTIVLSSLAKMGYKDDSHIKKFLQNIFDSQRLDGGWHCEEIRAKGQQLQDTESCPMDNLNVLMLLMQYDAFRTDSRFNGAIDLLLSHWSRRKEKWRLYGFGIGDRFTELKYPDVIYGILRVLDVLSMFPYAVYSNEFTDMLNFVLNKSSNGKYCAESVSRSYSEFDFGQTKVPSRWITFLINRIQKRVSAYKAG